jgi:hypothetical protein
MSENNELLKSEIFNDELKQNNSVSYRFNLTNPSNFSAYLYGLTSNANLYLYPDYNDNGVVDSDEDPNNSSFRSTNSGTTPESINKNLSAGNYLIIVENNSPTSTEYELRLVNESGSAVNIGELKDVIYKDVVGFRQPTDISDYYRFNLTNASNFSAYLYGLTNNANLYLYPDYNNNGVVDSDEDPNNSSFRSANSGTTPEFINKNLSAGNYLIIVENNSPTSTEYELRLVNESGSAVNIGELKDVIYKDVVGFRQPTDISDYYRFNLTNASNFSASLDRLTNNANLYLYPDYNNNGVVDSDEDPNNSSFRSANSGTTPESINKDLSAGNYLIIVENNSPTSTEYELRLVNEASNSNNQSQIIEYPEKSPVIVENPEDNLQIISPPIQETPSANTSNDGFQSVQRYWNNESLSHIFTANQKDVDDLTGQPDLFRYEGNEFDVPINEGDPVFRYVNINTGSHFLSFENGIDVTLSQFINTGTAFNAYKPVGTTEIRPADAPANAIPIYRLANLDAEERNPLNITHFYTSDENNKQLVLNTLNYRDEFIAFWALPAATDGLV